MIDKNFENVFKELRSLFAIQSGNLSQEAMTTAVLKGENDEPLDKYDWDSVKAFFSSEEIDKQINSALFGNDTEFNNVKSRMAMKAQSDLLDMLERDVKMASKNRITALSHEAARRLSASEKTGPVKSGILAFVDNLNRASVG